MIPLIEIYFRAVEWFYSFDWQSTYNTIVVVISVVNALLFGFFLLTLYRFSKLDEIVSVKENGSLTTHEVTPKMEVAEGWKHIQELISSSNPSEWNMAIIEADALLDDVLGHLGYEGETVAEKFKIIDPHQLSSLDRVWSAHRLRNSIVHDPLEQHTKETIAHALSSYGQALKELGVLENEKTA